MTADLPALLLSLLALGGLVAGAELLHRRLGCPPQLTRRLVHVGTGLFVVAIPWLFTRAAPVYLLAALFVVVNGVTAAAGVLRGMHPPGLRSWGTAAFPLALLVVLPFTWVEERRFILQTSFLVLALADPLAAAVGERWGRSVRIGRATKSAVGSITFALVAAGLVGLGIAVLAPPDAVAGGGAGSLILLAVVAGVVAAAVEALGGRGWDNFFVVTATAALLLLWQAQPERLGTMALGVVVGVGFGLLAARMQYLTLSGAIAGGLFAATLVGIGGWAWVVPGFTFFFLSSALSRWSPESKGAYRAAAARESRRNASQVYANGGVAWLLVVAFAFAPRDWLFWGFVAALAAAAADTWATELGPVFRQQPRMILSGRPVPAGSSGAVTLAGTLAGAVGAAVVWAAAWLPAGDALRGAGPMPTLLAVVGGGVLGSLADSVLGATLEGVYRDPASGALRDLPPGADPALAPERGWRRVDNQVVNVVCTAVGALVGMVVAG